MYAEEEEPTRGRGVANGEYSDSFCSTPSTSCTPIASPRLGELEGAPPPLFIAPGSSSENRAGPPKTSPRSLDEGTCLRDSLGSPMDGSPADAERYSSDSFCTAPSDAGSPLDTPGELSPRFSPAMSPFGRSTPQQSPAETPWSSPRVSGGGAWAPTGDVHSGRAAGGTTDPGSPPGCSTSPVSLGGGRNLSEEASTGAPFPSSPRREPGPLTLEGIRGAKARFLRVQQAVSPAAPDYSPLIAQLRPGTFGGAPPGRVEEERVYPSALVDRMRIYNLLHRMRQACSEIDALETRELPREVRETLFYRQKLRVLAGKEATQHLRATGVI